MYICVCKYPLIIIDNREGGNINYTALPSELIEGGTISSPEIFPVNIEGMDYISVQWQEFKGDIHIKEYEVVGHKVLAGCEPSEIKIINGELKCDNKKIFVVLHPLEEWQKKHIIELPLEK